MEKKLRDRLTRQLRRERRVVLAHYPRHHEPWSQAEDELLIKLINQALPARTAGTESAHYYAARKLGRSPMAVLKRAEIVKLIRRRGGH